MAFEIGAWEYVIATATASETITVTEGRTVETSAVAQAEASASETLTATDQATVSLLAYLVTVSAEETVTVADIALQALLTVLVELSEAESITVEDAAEQAVGILVSAAEYSGEDTLTSANW